MTEHQTPSARLAALFDAQRALNAEIVTALLEVTTATSAATTVAGYKTLKAQFDAFVDAGGLGFESLQALYAEQQAHMRAIQVELRELAAERRAVGEHVLRELAELRAQLTLRLPP